MVTYRTESGSIYDVDGKMVRRRVRSKISVSERVSDEWREAQSIDYSGLGRPLVIVWGLGPDEHSENALQVGEGDLIIRTTVTTPVMSVVEGN